MFDHSGSLLRPVVLAALVLSACDDTTTPGPDAGEPDADGAPGDADADRLDAEEADAEEAVGDADPLDADDELFDADPVDADTEADDDWTDADVSWTDADVDAPEPTHIDAPEDDLVVEHLPDLPFPAPDASMFEWIGEDGEPAVGLSLHDILVLLADGVTVGDLNELMAELTAELVGSTPEVSLILLRLPRADSMEDLAAVAEGLNADPRVVMAMVEDALMEPEHLPPLYPLDGSVAPNHYPTTHWTWDRPAAGAAPDGGNWGMKYIRLPQAWNLQDHLINNKLQHPEVGILDFGFTTKHPDLPSLSSAHVGDHGSKVAGIMAAAWADGAGIVGVLPLKTVIHAERPAFEGWSGEPKMATGGTLDTLVRLLKKTPARAINNSYGMSRYYCGGKTCIDPATKQVWKGGPTWRERMNSWGDFFQKVLVDGKVLPDAGALLVSSAGNCGLKTAVTCASPPPGHYIARDNSPLNNAAIRHPGTYYIAAGAIDEFGHPWSRSNREASMWAPGKSIESTTSDTSGTGSSYGTGSGTSFAAPHVTALAAYVWTLDTKLAPSELQSLLLDTADGGNVDAFAAVVGLDETRGNVEIQRALADMDDGTLDGNHRWRIMDEGCEDHDVASRGVCEVKTLPTRRGDGIIDIRDFRVLRDALVHAEGKGENLDGSAENVMRDLNRDGCVFEHGGAKGSGIVPWGIETDGGCGDAIDENDYPRMDLNGDGEVHRSESADLNGRSLTDLAVLAELFGLDGIGDVDEEAITLGFEGADLVRLLDSGDVHLDLSELSGAGEITLEVTGLPEPLKIAAPDAGHFIVSTPTKGGISIVARRPEADGSALCFQATMLAPEPGADVFAPLESCPVMMVPVAEGRNFRMGLVEYREPVIVRFGRTMEDQPVVARILQVNPDDPDGPPIDLSGGYRGDGGLWQRPRSSNGWHEGPGGETSEIHLAIPGMGISKIGEWVFGHMRAAAPEDERFVIRLERSDGAGPALVDGEGTPLETTPLDVPLPFTVSGSSGCTPEATCWPSWRWCCSLERCVEALGCTEAGAFEWGGCDCCAAPEVFSPLECGVCYSWFYEDIFHLSCPDG